KTAIGDIEDGCRSRLRHAFAAERDPVQRSREPDGPLDEPSAARGGISNTALRELLLARIARERTVHGRARRGRPLRGRKGRREGVLLAPRASGTGLSRAGPAVRAARESGPRLQAGSRRAGNAAERRRAHASVL